MNNNKTSDTSSKSKPGSSHYQKLKWLQKTRTVGLWVQCDECNRWRYLPDVLDRQQLSKKWYCNMNPDTTKANCSEPEDPVPFNEEEDLIHSEYSAGSLVVAQLPGWPWWPAMVDDCPDTEQYYWLDGFSDIPTYYNVTFFDANDVTRAWVAPEHLKSYADGQVLLQKSLQSKKYGKRINEAMKQADDAETLPLEKRLEKYSFITKFRGNIVSPKKVTKKEIQKHNNIFKRKYKVDLPCEYSDSEDSDDVFLSNIAKHDDIIEGKKAKIIKYTEDDETNVEENTMVSNEANTLFKTLSLTDTDVNNNLDTFKNSSVNDFTDASGITNEMQQHHRMPTPPSDDFDF
ncbi:zinc finger CW-type PWWP domain protein 1-like [Aricia agestis]|uniref:zinc finger CW-type PWWP domain protein 1-like n=1 Tax=Aricia agestis TaxID=91739 RepID=UPI001C20B9A2|nr:zinc finger CW-type PWWP domain protein 1-like [Aricia agestis]